jgi:hypothetical protein
MTLSDDEKIYAMHDLPYSLINLLLIDMIAAKAVEVYKELEHDQEI